MKGGQNESIFWLKQVSLCCFLHVFSEIKISYWYFVYYFD